MVTQVRVQLDSFRADDVTNEVTYKEEPGQDQVLGLEANLWSASIY